MRRVTRSVTRSKTCVAEAPFYHCSFNPDVYVERITRNRSKLIRGIKQFIIYEVYRCMPLLGDEHNIPNWDIHIVKYSVVFS